MDILVLIGLILFAFLLLGSGIGHIMGCKALAGYAQAKGVPSAEPSVVGSGVPTMAGGLWAVLGALFLRAETMHSCTPSSSNIQALRIRASTK